MLDGPFIQHKPWYHVADQHVRLAVQSAQQSLGVAAGGEGPREPWSISTLYKNVQFASKTRGARAGAEAGAETRGANRCPLGSDVRRSTPEAHPFEGQAGHGGRDGSSSTTVVITNDASAQKGRKQSQKKIECNGSDGCFNVTTSQIPSPEHSLHESHTATDGLQTSGRRVAVV